MLNIFNPEYLKGEFQAFHFSHLAALFVLIVTCIAMVLIFKKIKNEKVEFIFCIIVAVLTYGQEITRMLWHIVIGTFSIGEHLPLHLCGLGIILGPIMILKKNFKLYELIYFWGFGGAIQALATPDMIYEFPHFVYWQYFVSHSLIILSCVYMTFVVGYRPTWKSIVKVFIVTNIYMAIIILVNVATNGNYMFLCHKPANPSIIDFLGPWPWYILSLEGVGILSFLIYYSPFFIKDLIDKVRKKEKITVEEETVSSKN